MSVEVAIEKLERLYETVTGNQAPKIEKPYAPIRPEVDPSLQVNQHMDLLMGALQGERQNIQAQTWTPAIQVCETKESYLFRMDLPGVKKTDIHMVIQASKLIVKGIREWNFGKVQDINFRHSEIPHGSFERVLTIPAFTLIKDIKAVFDNGVLEIRLPKDQAFVSVHEVPIQ